MVGATPGAALIFGAWYLNKRPAGYLVVAGHIGSVVGAVLSYRA